MTCKPYWYGCARAVAGLAIVILTGLSAYEARGADAAGIIGKVVSSETGAPLAFASVALMHLESATDTTGTPSGGAMTKPDGSYRIVAKPGLYKIVVRFVSYHHRSVTAIEVLEGQVATVDVSLVPDAMTLKTVQITAKAIENTEASVLAQQKRAPAVSDGISSQQIAKSTDSNAAEALQRVTGLSIVGRRYVYVRGLGERYSSTQINGATVGTPEPNKRVVPLDLFASSLLDNVVVQKTYTPDQPGEFGGGVVNVSTRDFPGRKLWDFSVSAGGNGTTTGKTFYTYQGGKTDFLGIDDGTRDLPGVVDRLARNTKITRRGAFSSAGFSADTVGILGRAFNRTWNRKTQTGLPSYAVNATYGNELDLLDRPLGFLGSFSMSNGFRTTEGEENVYKSDGGILIPETAYDVTTSEATTLWGAIANSSYRLNDFNTISLRGIYNRSAEDEVRFYEGENNDSGKPLRNSRFDYVERGLFASSVSTSHTLTHMGNAKVDLRYNYSRAVRSEPDRREYNYEFERDYVVVDEEIVDSLDVWRLSGRSASLGLTRMFGRSVEDERSPEINLTIPFKQWGRLDSKFRFGALVKNKDRDSSWRRFFYSAPSSGGGAGLDSILALSPEQILTDERIGGASTTFMLQELTKPESDNYRAHQDLTAGFAMFDLPLSTKWRAVFGARIEDATMKVESYDIFHLTPDSLLAKAKLSNTDLLPAVNLSYALREDLTVRGAYSVTVSRPDFRELSNFWITDYVSGYPEVGNPELKRAKIRNTDLRVEAYPSPNELLAASLFYKDLVNPIERSLQGGETPVYKPINGKGGSIAGTELEARVGLDRVSPKLAPFATTANITLVRSRTDVSKLGVETSQKRPLEGQSPYVVNLGLFYANANGTTGATLMVNRFGRRLSRVGVQGLPDIYEQPRTSVDMTYSRRTGIGRLKLSLENLFDDDVRFEQKGIIEKTSKVTSRFRDGRSISLSISTGS